MFTLDNVDWTQIAPDNTTGLQFPVQLHTSCGLSYIKSRPADRLRLRSRSCG